MLRAFLLCLLFASLGACGDDDFGPARDMAVGDAATDASETD
jgi:hypothetical protein